MTAPTAELWRVLDDHPSSPAHLVARPGKRIDRAEMFTHRFACTNCMRHARRSVLIGEQVRDNRGGRA